MNTASSSSYQSFLMGHTDSPYHLNHIMEFSELSRRITIETINEIVPSMIESVCIKVIKEYLNSNINGSFSYDVHNIATLSIKILIL